ncbi:MAG: AarF/ABC1/UbiB kinase family protein [Moraxellaceae bacterium]|nr:AarF/ABC1/UbiB kinase family protein [Moraxellaceae bacterium]
MQNPQFKKILKTPLNALGRIGKTAKVASLAGVRIAKGEKPSPKMLRESFEEMGTTYIKIGQFIASMPSVFPYEYVAEFQSCLDQTTPLPFSYIEQVLIEELTDETTKLTDLFAHIDPIPLASASIAQVHPATLLDGTEVVLKVQKPNVDTIISTDLGMLYGVNKIIELLIQGHKFSSYYQSIAPIIDEIRIRMQAETDFLQEAENIADFHQFLADSDNQNVTAPQVINNLTTKRVLTMTRLHGVSMIDMEGMKRYCLDPAKVMADTLNTWFASVMQAKNFHADLHAGNLMLLTDGRIGFIDFGIVGQVQPQSWQASYAMMDAIPQRDYRKMAECMIDIGMTKDRSQIDIFQLADDIKAMIDSIMGVEVDSEMLNNMKTVNSDSINQANQTLDEMNQLLLKLAEIGKRHGIRFPRDFVLLTKQMLYFDRYMQVLAPDMDMFHDTNIKMVG